MTTARTLILTLQQAAADTGYRGTPFQGKLSSALCALGWASVVGVLVALGLACFPNAMVAQLTAQLGALGALTVTMGTMAGFMAVEINIAKVAQRRENALIEAALEGATTEALMIARTSPELSSAVRKQIEQHLSAHHQGWSALVAPQLSLGKEEGDSNLALPPPAEPLPLLLGLTP